MALVDETGIYLTLSAEFGGTRFGPFEGLEVRLGTDGERCHIVLPEAFGVSREHCKLIRQGDGGLILAASERTAAVFVWKGDARRPNQIQSPTSVRSGDSFALVSPEGARFQIEVARLPEEVLLKRNPKRRRNNLTAEKFAQEGWRLFLARIWTLGPFALAARGWYMITSGAILQPRIIIPLVIASVGYIGTAGSSCAAIKFKSDVAKAEESLGECEQRAGVGVGGGGGLASKGPRDLVAMILGSTYLAAALQNQDELQSQVERELTDVFASRQQYGWLFDEGGAAASEWISWRERVEKSEQFDPVTKALLPYASAMPKRTREEWNVQLDVRNRRTCMRGPARLTYRQARSLGLKSLQLDGYRGDDTLGFVDDEAGRFQLLKDTALGANEGLPETAPQIEQAQLASGREFCLYGAGEDDRTSASKVLGALERHLGLKASAVPPTSQNEAGIARIVKLYAADVPGNIYEDNDTPRLDFRNGMAAPLKEEESKASIVARTAEVIARSVALPCMAALEAPDTVEPMFGRKVDPVTCLVLEYKLRNKK
jgi:hypothetical protein